MDKQPLNTGEQKDMTEFFTDLISKMEEMSPSLVREQNYFCLVYWQQLALALMFSNSLFGIRFEYTSNIVELVSLTSLLQYLLW